jgi:hypothetical protein
VNPKQKKKRKKTINKRFGGKRKKWVGEKHLFI